MKGMYLLHPFFIIEKPVAVPGYSFIFLDQHSRLEDPLLEYVKFINNYSILHNINYRLFVSYYHKS